MNRSIPRRAFPAAAVLAAAVLVALSRAASRAVRDGWLGAGLLALGTRSLARNLLAGLALALPAALALALCARRWPLSAFTAAAILAWAFVSGRLPADPFHTPGFGSAAGWAGNALAAGSALLASAWSLRPPRFHDRAQRVLAGAAVGVVLLSLGVVARPVNARANRRPSVILISLDTVRRDRLGCYGYPLATTPAIDRFARTAVRFENVFCAAPWTLSSHMTMLTSLDPASHGVDADHGLPYWAPTLARSFREAGYATAALVDSIGWLHPWFGFDRGFATYRRVAGDARAKNEALGPLLDDLQDAEPFFLLLHYFDAHGDWGAVPYESPREDREAFAGWYPGRGEIRDAEGHRGVAALHAWADAGRVPGEDVLRLLRSLYDAGLHALDRELGSLFRDLERRGLLERSIVALTSDHGEEFFEHGGATHTQLFVETTAVPLLIRPPGGAPARTIAPIAGLVDLAPTLLDLCDLAPPAAMQGRSLARLVRGESEGAARPYVVLSLGEDQRGLRTDRWSLIRHGNRRLLFDLARDPAEREDLLGGGAGTAEAAALDRLLDRALRAERAIRAARGEPGPLGRLAEKEVERLRALGYVQR